MATATSKYLGDLMISSTHVRSGYQLETDAPVDNNGKGSRFSPTDLLATAYMDCMITIMGIYCNQHGIKFEHCEGEVEKIMESNPRRVGALNIKINLKGNDWDEDTKHKVEAAGRACPVARSVSPEMKVDVHFCY